MSKATDEPAETAVKNQPSAGSVSGGFAGRVKPSQKKIIIGAVALLLVLIVLIGFTAYRQLHPGRDFHKAQYDGTTDFYTIDSTEVPVKIQPVLGISENDLRTKPINARLFPDYGASYAGAKALVMLGENKRALMAFRLAESQSGRAKLGDAERYDFHYEYSAAARIAKDDALFKSQLKKAKNVVNGMDNKDPNKAFLQKQILIMEKDE